MHSFIYEPLPARVIFGRGRIGDLPAEVERLGAHRALVITTSNQREAGQLVASLLGERAVAAFDDATMHTPVDVTERALEVLRANDCDVLVAVGGGSTIGLGKALSLRTGLPQIVIPTTYAGSEVTPILGETANGVKKTLRSPRLLPGTVIYDVEQTMSLPAALSASSGLNAIAHAAEALYARDANPVISFMATEGIAALANSLPRIVESPTDIEVRSQAQFGAWLCGSCLGAVGMAIHHKLCHVLGGTFNLPHAETHSIVLPYALAYNAAAAAPAMSAIGKALGGTDRPWLRLHEMLRALKLPTSLAQIGMPESGLPRALELTLKDSYWNPRPLEAGPLQRLLQAAWDGRPPELY